MARTAATDVQARRAEILKHLGKESFMGVEDLSSLLGVSPATIRRDLDALQVDGKLNRRHGGAVARDDTLPRGGGGVKTVESSAETEQTDIVPVARRIAAHAATTLSPGEVVLVSHGPISQELASLIVDFRDLTVITNSLDVFDTLRSSEHVHLLATGGELRHPQKTFVGPLAEASISEIRVDRFFLEPSGISHDRQLYCASLPDVSIQQAMIHAAREVIILADHSTFEKEGIMPLAPLDVAVGIITDCEPPEAIAETLETEGFRFVKVE